MLIGFDNDGPFICLPEEDEVARRWLDRWLTAWQSHVIGNIAEKAKERTG